MGQTLPNGIYLPAEGERNCYDGLEGNWRSLDGLISTVAGKASASHTHGNITNDGKVGTTANLPLITGTGGVVQAGSFGNQANTFCEGNDSRLSDARTPVAHTHTKSDVTDLLNSNFIPSANNSYDLGSSSYQWNNLYAKNYYYNGVAWGLDKANVWTASQTLSSNSFLTVRGYRFRIKNDSMILGTAPSSNQWTGMQFVDKNDNPISEIVQSFQSNGNSLYQINVYPNEANSEKRSVISYTYSSTNNINNVSFSSNVTPQNSNTYDLGTSTNKWKSLNGINPGALSLPNLDSTVSLTTTLQAAIDKTQTVNSWTANFTGILCINWITKNLTGPYRCSVYNASDIKNATWGQTFWADNVWYFIVSFPVQNGKTYYFDNTFTRTSEDSAHIVHSANAVYTLGNV